MLRVVEANTGNFRIEGRPLVPSAPRAPRYWRAFLRRDAPKRNTALAEYNGTSSEGICRLVELGLRRLSGNPGVAEHRAYVVGHDGHFLRFEALICADDAEANREGQAPCR